MRRAVWSCLLLVAFGCDAVGEFNTDSGDIYEGVVVGVDDPDNCPNGIDCSFIRRGFPSTTVLEMTFDTDALFTEPGTCLLYTSPSPRDRTRSRMPSSA